MRGLYSDLWQAIAAEAPHRTAIASRAGELDYGAFSREAAALAAFLRGNGVAPGDSMAILLYNRPEYLVALFAGFASGIAPTPINYRFQGREVAELLLDSGATALLYPSSLADVVLQAIGVSGRVPLLVEISDDEGHLPGATRYQDAVAHEAAPLTAARPGGELRLYTGGTTGRPKAVVWGAEDIFEVQQFAIYGAVGVPVPDSIDAAVRVAVDPSTPEVVTLPLAPFMHGTALFNSMNTLALGGTVVTTSSPRYQPDEALRLIADFGATRLIVAGDAVAVPLVEAADHASATTLGSVDSVISSGMRFSDSTKQRLHSLGRITIMDMLASTEGGPFAVNTTTTATELPGAFRLLPGAVVLDEQFDEVQDRPGATGILGFRGALPKGYLHDEEKTRAAFPMLRGVRHVVPGDLVEVLDDHRIALLGRGSSVVNTGGEKVYPAEVEEALLAYPGIADAVVLGMPDPRFGEVVTAVVAPKAGATIDTRGLVDFVAGRLAGYKKPRHVLVRSSIERSPHGKVDMPRLRAEVTAELALDSDSPPRSRPVPPEARSA